MSGLTASAPRFWSKVDPCRTDGCALWLGALNNKGYGTLRVEGVQIYAHHFLVGRPPSGLEWDHVKARGCSHRECVWPDHLELVSHRENVLRSDSLTVRNAAKTHCPSGHAYDEANIYVYRGWRLCRECRHLRRTNVKRHGQLESLR